jgi:hypothetical protein
MPRGGANDSFSFARQLLVTFSSGPKTLATNPKLVRSLRLQQFVREDAINPECHSGRDSYCVRRQWTIFVRSFPPLVRRLTAGIGLETRSK